MQATRINFKVFGPNPQAGRIVFRMPLSIIMNPQAFKKMIPKNPRLKIPFMLSALAVLKLHVKSQDIEKNNHILDELKKFVESCDSQEILDLGLQGALIMSKSKRDKGERWAGKAALSVMPNGQLDSQDGLVPTQI